MTKARWDAVWGVILQGLTERNDSYEEYWDFDDPDHPSKEIRDAYEGATILFRRYDKSGD